MSFFSVIRDWVTFAADICILLITVYTFYITFISEKIKLLTISESLSNSAGDQFSVVLENKTLSPIVIKDINLIIDNQYKVQMRRFESPIILEPFTAQKVLSERYSYTVPNLPTISGFNTVLEVSTSRKKLFLRLHKKADKVSKKMKHEPHNVVKITNNYNGKVVPKNARFALIVSKEEWQKTVFIFSTGDMTEDILGFNGIPEEVLNDEETLIQFLDNWLKPNGVNYYLDSLSNLFDKSLRDNGKNDK